jgi:hypothetical protein
VTELRGTRALAWADESPKGFDLQSIFLGQNTDGLGACEVATLTSGQTPTRETLRDLHKKRKAGRNVTCLVIAAQSGDRTYIFGPDDQTQIVSLPSEQARRVLQAALDEPSSRDAYTRFVTNWRALESTGIAGFTNNGLFASYHIRVNVVQRQDWPDQCSRSESVRDKRHLELIKSLGFTAETTVGNALVLSATGQSPRAVAVLLDDSEHFDSKSAKYQLSPVAWGLNVASKQDVPWLVVLRKDQIRLYPGKDGVGVGNKGQVETFFEMNLTEIDDAHVGLLNLIFSADALAAGGTADQLLSESQRYAVALGERLRERIYVHVVPGLAIAIADELPALGLKRDADGLNVAYRLTLRILFRLLFQAYAEDRGLLPSGRNELYDANSLKTIATRIQNADPDEFGTSSSFWKDLTQIWDIIDEGNESFQVPAYNGGLFGRDQAQHPEGALIEKLRLTDNILGPALQHLVIDISEDGVRGQVDFRSLSVREFGTIYEGLLESSLSVTDIDLTVDKNGAWVPAGASTTVDAPAGTVYFHSASGERKATGSYFTPSFIVDHLISRSLDPALDKHLAHIKGHLDDGNHGAAARDFFDFRVADLAMGSGHFLVAAVDRIESKMRSFLAEPDNEVPGVTEELLRLAETAKKALGRDEVAIGEIEPIGLLRRQVARRCIYGLDINPLAVELTRLALWIHTFVPGLPMSNLDHGLVCANSLTGIGTLEEAKDALQPKRIPGQATFLDEAIETRLAGLRDTLIQVANASEASKKEVHDGAAKAMLALEAAEPAKRIFDLAVAARMGKASPVGVISVDDLIDEDALVARSFEPRVQEALTSLNPAHMPFLFPEVFLRDNSGFDVVIGNPPWEELMLEKTKFWLRYSPGLLALKAGALKARLESLIEEYPDRHEEFLRESATVGKARAVLMSGPYPDLGNGDVDLYQAFAWRNWQMLNSDGSAGLVFPRSLFNGAGGSTWRQEVFPKSSARLSTFINTGGWVFPSVHGQYSVATLCLTKGTEAPGIIHFQGPYANLSSLINGQNSSNAADFDLFLASAEGGAIPQLPSTASVEVFKQLRKSPRLDKPSLSVAFRAASEFHATNDRPIFDSAMETDAAALPVLGGSGFNLWTPRTGEVYAWADEFKVEEALFAKRRNQVRMRNSAFYGLPPETLADRGSLPFRHSRVAFRDVTNATNTRTVIASIVQPNALLTNTAPFFNNVTQNIRAEAFLLGILSSLPLDWFARRYVELHLNFHIAHGLPVPWDGLETNLGNQLINLVFSRLSKISTVADWTDQLAEAGALDLGEMSDVDFEAKVHGTASALYGLDEEQVRHIFETFHVGSDYGPLLQSTLTEFERLRSKE